MADPSNFDLRSTRNRVRHLLLPHLRATEPDVDEHLLRLAQVANRHRARVESQLRRRLRPDRRGDSGSIERQALEKLAPALWPQALALLHRDVEAGYPPPRAARHELQRQLRAGGRVGVDCGNQWRWHGTDDRLILSRQATSNPGFAYTVEAPGECVIPELALRFRIRPGAVDDWMFRPSARRAGLDLPIGPGDRVVVRSRRDGDRIRPFGCKYTRRVKDVLIDRRVPRQERMRIPFLEVDSRLAWIPGVTVEDTFRVEAGGRAWIAELEPV